MSAEYVPLEEAPTREEVDRTPGLALLEFGTNWCGICRAAAPGIEALLREHPQVRHLKVEDGSGRALGRSFQVKLWPTLIFLKDGVAVRRLVRPRPEELTEAFAALTKT